MGILDAPHAFTLHVKMHVERIITLIIDIQLVGWVGRYLNFLQNTSVHCILRMQESSGWVVGIMLHKI
jgi:hypothetical protein